MASSLADSECVHCLGSHGNAIAALQHLRIVVSATCDRQASLSATGCSIPEALAPQAAHI